MTIPEKSAIFQFMMGRKLIFLGGIVGLSAMLAYPANQFAAESNYQDQAFRDIENERGYPVRGTSSKSVLAKYGEPLSRKGPVGDPPISTWYYEEFNVYFEHHLVITSVATQDRLPTKLKEIQ